jgi:hypothetical protein
MTIEGPILAIGKIKPCSTPNIGAGPKCLTVEVRTPTSGAEFLDLDIARDAIADLVKKLTNVLNDPNVLDDPNFLKS